MPQLRPTTLSSRLALLGAVLATVLLSAGFTFWLIMLSPFLHQWPEDWQAADPQRSHRVFVYGTLRSGVVRWLVKGRAGEVEAQVLPDHIKSGLDIEEAPGKQLEGVVLEVSAAELRRLDRYERIGLRYQRELLTLADGSEAWVYSRL